MTAAILSAKRGLSAFQRHLWELLSWRVLFPLALLSVAWYTPAAGRIMVETIAEAYLQVSVFVAGTLALIYSCESLFKFDLADTLHTRPRLQIPIASFLGALPGCGGAIVVVTQYVNGHVGFGALIAVLTATMGDAAFLLLSQEPATAGLVFLMGMVAGTLCGLLIDAIHGPEFMRAESAATPEQADARVQQGRRVQQTLALDPIWLALMVPGLIFAIPIALQLDPNTWFGPIAAYQPVTLLGFAGGILALAMWTAHMTTEPSRLCTVGANPNDREPVKPTARSRIINDTNFVTVWVILAFLLFELGMYFTGADLKGWFEVWAPLAPLIAMLVGFIPGCGPQIIVTTLYLTGVVPVAALVANAISNDGDALFPAIALSPRAAIVATIYTGIPALILGYAVYLLL